MTQSALCQQAPVSGSPFSRTLPRRSTGLSDNVRVTGTAGLARHPDQALAGMEVAGATPASRRIRLGVAESLSRCITMCCTCSLPRRRRCPTTACLIWVAECSLIGNRALTAATMALLGHGPGRVSGASRRLRP